MARERMKQLCDCGCGQQAYQNQLVEVRVEEAIDATLRQTQTKKRFWVLRDCKTAFEEELALSTQLQLIVRYWGALALKPKTALQRLNLFRTFAMWCRRVGAARKVMTIQHAIYVRTKGFDYASTRAKQSAILFGAPRFMQSFLSRRYMGRLARVTALAREGDAASEVAGKTEITASPNGVTAQG